MTSAESHPAERPAPRRAHRFRLAAVVVLAVLVVGCRSSVTTGFEVGADPDPTVGVSVVVEFDQVAASAFGPELTGLLEETIVARTGQRPRVSGDGGTLRFEVPVTYAQLAELAPLTGVADVRLELLGGDLGVLHIELVEPYELRAALEAAAATQPDAAALTATLLRFSEVGATVRFVGGVIQIRTPEIEVVPSVERDTVRVVQPLDRYISGPLTVAGSLRAPDRGRHWPPLVAGVALALLAGTVWSVRRRP
jgi:hypothetical protein